MKLWAAASWLVASAVFFVAQMDWLVDLAKTSPAIAALIVALGYIVYAEVIKPRRKTTPSAGELPKEHWENVQAHNADRIIVHTSKLHEEALSIGRQQTQILQGLTFTLDSLRSGQESIRAGQEAIRIDLAKIPKRRSDD